MPTYSVMQNVKGGTFNRQGLQTTATRLYTVTRTDASVCTREEATTATGIPAINDSYAGSYGALKCNNVVAKQISQNYLEVTASYAIGNYVNASMDPLDELPIVQWQYNVSSEEIDRDVLRNPILNGAGDPVPGCRNNFYLDIIQVTVNLAYYDSSFWAAYRNTVNSDTITSIPFNLTIDPGYCRCVSVQPTRAYRVTDSWVPVQITLEIADSNQPANPFQLRFVNQGSQSYYVDNNSVTRKGRIVWKDSLQPTDKDVLLDRFGKPIQDNGTNSSYLVIGAHGDTGHAPVNNPNGAPTGSWYETSSSYAAVYFLYEKCFPMAFTGSGNLFDSLGLE